MRIFRNCLFKGWVDTRVFRFFTGHTSDMTAQPVRSFLAFHRYTCSFIKTSWPKPSNTHVFSADAVPDTLSLQGSTYANVRAPCTTHPGRAAGTWGGGQLQPLLLGSRQREQTGQLNYTQSSFKKCPYSRQALGTASWQELTLVLPLTFTSGLRR